MTEKKDILPQVLLTKEAWAAWHQQVASIGPAMLAKYPNLRPEDIPDEEGKLVGDQLRIHVTLPDGTVLAEMLIPAGHWGWMQG